MKSYTRACPLCSVPMVSDRAGNGFADHCAEHHPNHIYYLHPSGDCTRSTITFLEKNYWCPLDERWYGSRKYLARTIAAHGMTNEEYYLRHGESHMEQEWRENNEDEKFGNAKSTPTCLQCTATVQFNNPKWHYPAFCGSSCSTSWHGEHTDRAQRAADVRKEREAVNPDHGLRPNQLRYWVLRGHTEEEAMELVSNRQKAGTLERMVERYGEEEGSARYNEGLTNRKNGIKNSSMTSGVSEISVELFEKVHKALGMDVDLRYGDSETSIVGISNGSKKNIWVDCLYPERKKVIEFYGVFWHASPRKYLAEDVVFKSVGRTAQQVWDKDAAKERAIKSAGYDLLVVWEDQYRDNPDYVVDKCIAHMAT